MDHAESGSGPLPPELKLAWLCGDEHLPDPGGVLDQDYVTLHRMSVYRNVHQVVVRFRGLHGAEIHSLTDGERRVIKALRAEGLL